MTLTELRYIVTIAKEQHFGRAAERCHVSQPTLSIALKRLEEELGIAIFERNKSHVYSTPIGEKIIEEAQKLLEHACTIKTIANSGKNQLSSPLRIGAIFTVGPYLFPHFIPQLHNQAPEMALYVEESHSATLLRRLRQGELDVIIISLPFEESDIVTQPLYEEVFVVQMSADHPLAKFDTIHPDQLTEHNVFLLGDGHCFREQVLNACPNLRPSINGIKSRVQTAAEGSSLETLKHMVSTGLGISILPFSAAFTTQTASQLVTRPFVDPVPQRTIGLATRASFPREKAIEALYNAINQCQLMHDQNHINV